MGANILLMIAASFLLLGSAAAGYGPVGNEVFHVAGKVLCQDCSQGWNEWVNGANPIKGCKVSVTCLDDRGKAIHFASDTTDDAGDFDITCNKYTANGKKINPQNCYLRLVSSPDPVCNIATNFAGGKSGVKLHRPTVVYRDILKYVLGPFYYTTPMCDEPDTSTPDEDDSDNYGKKSNYGNDGKESNYGDDGKKNNYGDDGKQSNYGDDSKQDNYADDGKQSNYGGDGKQGNYGDDGKQSNYGDDGKQGNYGGDGEQGNYGDDGKQSNDKQSKYGDDGKQDNYGDDGKQGNYSDDGKQRNY